MLHIRINIYVSFTFKHVHTQTKTEIHTYIHAHTHFYLLNSSLYTLILLIHPVSPTHLPPTSCRWTGGTTSQGQIWFVSFRRSSRIQNHYICRKQGLWWQVRERVCWSMNELMNVLMSLHSHGSWCTWSTYFPLTLSYRIPITTWHNLINVILCTIH